MNAGRKGAGINRKLIAKAVAEAMKDDRDSWDFGFPDREELWHNASYETWARAPFWSADECAALTLGKDPSQISGLDIDQLYRTALFGWSLEHIREEILEAQADKELPERIRPVEFIAWARERKIRFSDQLEAAVLDNEADVAALQRRNTKLRNEIQKLRYELDRLQGSTSSHAKEPSTNEELSKKVRNSLHKLILGMAIAKYKWKPTADRHPAASNIADDLNCLEQDGVNLGLGLDQDTVLKYLREAKDVLP